MHRAAQTKEGKIYGPDVDDFLVGTILLVQEYRRIPDWRLRAFVLPNRSFPYWSVCDAIGTKKKKQTHTHSTYRPRNVGSRRGIKKKEGGKKTTGGAGSQQEEQHTFTLAVTLRKVALPPMTQARSSSLRHLRDSGVRPAGRHARVWPRKPAVWYRKPSLIRFRSVLRLRVSVSPPWVSLRC